MTDYTELDRINTRLDANVAEWFFAIGAWIQSKLDSGEYKTVKGAGLDCANRCEKTGRAVSTATIYAAHKAAYSFHDSLQKAIIKTACPLGVLQQLSSSTEQYVDELTQDVVAGETTWLAYSRKKQRKQGPRLNWGAPKHDSKYTQPEPVKMGSSGVPRVIESQINPPAQIAGEKINVEDDDSIVFGLSNLIARLGKRFPAYLKLAIDRVNKGKREEEKIKI